MITSYGNIGSFSTTINYKDIDIYDSSELGEVELSTSDAKVKWHCDTECREWGIKGLSIFIDSVEFSLFTEDNDKKESEIVVDSKDGWTVTTNESRERNLSDDVNPQSLEVNYKKRTIEVTF